VAAALILAAAIAGADYGAGPVLVDLLSVSAGVQTPMPGALQDLAVPWSAGVTLLPAVPFYLVGLAVYLARVGRSLMRLKGYPPEHRERAIALSAYAAAPLAWLLPASVLHVMAFWVRSVPAYQASGGEVGPRAGALALEVVAALAVAVAVLSTLHRSGEWSARAHHAGAGRLAAGVAELIGRSFLGLILFLGVVPWCAGLAWIILDSFR
jgi:hypothetical protein